MYKNEAVLKHEFDTELYITHRVFGKNDTKIEVYYFYHGIKNGTWLLDFYPDGKCYRYGGLIEERLVLAMGAINNNRLN